jgi:hypothetical protein
MPIDFSITGNLFSIVGCCKYIVKMIEVNYPLLFLMVCGLPESVENFKLALLITFSFSRLIFFAADSQILKLWQISIALC